MRTLCVTVAAADTLLGGAEASFVVQAGAWPRVAPGSTSTLYVPGASEAATAPAASAVIVVRTVGVPLEGAPPSMLTVPPGARLVELNVTRAPGSGAPDEVVAVVASAIGTTSSNANPT